MKITFVAMGCELLGLESLSSVLKEQGHNVSLVFDPSLFDDKVYFNMGFLARLFEVNKKKLIKKVIETNPDLIGFYIITDNYRWTEGIAKGIKERINVPIICGGIYPTSNPEIMIKKDWVDILCRGEGEYPMIELSESMSKGVINYSIKNLWFKKGKRLIKNPMRAMMKPKEWGEYDKTLFEDVIPIGNNYITVTSKGCPFKCSYCSESFLQPIYSLTGRYFVKKDVDDVIKELKFMKKKYDFKTIDIRDNVFTSDKKWLLDFCERYEKELKRTPFKVMTHPATIDTDMAIALRKAGCFKCQFGVQSMNEVTRRNVLKRYELNKDIIRGFDACDIAGLPYSIDHIFNIPGETEDDQIKACNIYAKCKSLMRITCFWLSYFPQTEIVSIACRMGEITKKDVEEINNLKDESFYLKTGSLKDKGKIRIFRGYNLLMRAIPILPERTIKFILKHNLQKYFKYLPRYPVLWIIDFFVSIKKKDLEGLTYLKYYLWQIKRLLIRGG